MGIGVYGHTVYGYSIYGLLEKTKKKFLNSQELFG